MVIKNFKQLATTSLRRDALDIIEAGFDSINTKKIIENNIKLYKNGFLKIQEAWVDLRKYRRIYFVGIGKAAFAAAAATEKILGDKITEGVVLDVQGGDLKRIRSVIGSHPLPTQKNVTATREIISLLQSAKEEDLIIAVISGGGSALLCSPYQISCEEKAEVIDALMKSGATIDEINTVRKHLSEIKGGNFARFAYPAKVISLIFSDVASNDISMVASGPTVLDITTTTDASKIMAKYGVLEKCKLPHCDLVETPKDPTYFIRVVNLVIADNYIILKAMTERARKLRYKPEILSAGIQGEAEKVAKKLVLNAKPKTALLAAGETTIKVVGRGVGGRNLHTVLAALEYLQEGKVVVSVNSDGVDHGLYAGAIGDYKTVEKVKKSKLSINEFLDNCDSFHFFQKTGDGIETGVLGQNMADFMLVLAE